MPDFWMDADSFITAHRGPYRFQAIPQVWEFLEEKARERVIASPQFVLDKELSADPGDEQDVLEKWAKKLKDTLFWEPTEPVQACYTEVADYVDNCGRYKQQWVRTFLSPSTLYNGHSQNATPAASVTVNLDALRKQRGPGLSSRASFYAAPAGGAGGVPS